MLDTRKKENNTISSQKNLSERLAPVFFGLHAIKYHRYEKFAQEYR